MRCSCGCDSYASAGRVATIVVAPLGDPNFTQTLIRETPKTMPTYDKAMSPLDVKELIESSLALAGIASLQTADFRPAKFGASDGFRFEFTCARPEGLKQKGFVVGRQTATSLQLVIFIAAATYYFERDLPEAERIVASIQ